LHGAFRWTDNEFTLRGFGSAIGDKMGSERKYRNDETGAPAFDPAVSLKVILVAY